MRGSAFRPVASGLACTFGEFGSAPASFISDAELRCAAPRAASPSTVDVTISLGSESELSGGRAAEFTYYDDASPPVLGSLGSRIIERSAAASGAAVVEARGSNLAPTPGIGCIFAENSPSAASFVSTDKVLCAPPKLEAAVTLPLRLTLDGGKTTSVDALGVTFYDGAVPPVRAIMPL